MTRHDGSDPISTAKGDQAAADQPASGRMGSSASERAHAAGQLANSLQSLIFESQQLRTDVRAAEAQRIREMTRRRQENLAMFGLLAILSLLMILMITVAWQNNTLAQEVKSNSAKLSDCTTPGGKCYTESQARTGRAVRNIQLIQLYIVECSRQFPVDRYPPGPTFDRLFEKCVADRVDAENAAERGGAPSPGTKPSPAPSPSPSPNVVPR